MTWEIYEVRKPRKEFVDTASGVNVGTNWDEQILGPQRVLNRPRDASAYLDVDLGKGNRGQL
jgi:hypothetical protein